MTTLHAPAALLDDGWKPDVAIDIADDGRITRVEAGAAKRGERLEGPVIPAMPNLHSHAFQRAMAGRTGKPSPSRDDSFWTWRQAMYATVERLDADAFEAITAQAYVEMAKAGYSAVAEFHYVHHDPHGKPYTDPAELAWRVVGAAATAGIGLTLLPVFYAHGDFGGGACLERRAAIQPAARARERRSALVHRARDAHDGEGVARPCGDQRRRRPRALHGG
jgi:formimidoylglutamate deiminase